MKQKTPRISPVRLLLIGGIIILALVLLIPRGSGTPDLEVSRVIQMAESGEIARIEVRGDKVECHQHQR